MADSYAELLKRFDPIAIARYEITARDLETIDQYIQILQPRVSVSAWDEAITIGGEYGTSIIIHEVIQIRALQRAGIQPLKYNIAALQNLLAKNIDAHVTALYDEHLYLQEVLAGKFELHFEIATLIRANQLDDTDLNRLLESDVGIFRFESDRVEEARQALKRLKGR